MRYKALVDIEFAQHVAWNGKYHVCWDQFTTESKPCNRNTEAGEKTRYDESHEWIPFPKPKTDPIRDAAMTHSTHAGAASRFMEEVMLDRAV